MTVRRILLPLAVGVVAPFALGLAPLQAHAACTGTISCGAPVVGSIDVAGEIDCYSFAGTAGDGVSVVENEITGGAFNTCFTLKRPGGEVITTACTGRRNAKLPETGTYSIEVNENFNDGVGSYRLSYTVVSASASRCAGTIACGETLPGNISVPTESDTYAFEAAAGEVVSITTSETDAGPSKCWELYGPTGTSLDTACDQKEVALPDLGSYTIRVFDNLEDGTGAYNVNLSFVSATASSCTAPIACGQTIPGTIGAIAENDTFSFTTTQADESVQVTTSGGGGAFTPCWSVYAPTGALLSPVAGPTLVCGQGQAILAEAGTYTIRVGDQQHNATGSYNAALLCLGTATPTASATPTPSLTGTVATTPTETRSPSPSLTPTATSETPTPTPTASPLETATPSGVATPSGGTLTATATPTATVMPTPSGPPPSLADPAAAKAALRCQKTLTSAGAKLVSRRLKRLDGCATRMLGCLQTRPGQTSCRDKAIAACRREVAKLGDDEATMRAAVVKRCGLLRLADLKSMAGLGFDAQTTLCDGLGIPLVDAAGLAACTAARHNCWADQLMVSAEPRAGELLRLADVSLAPGDCLTDFAGSGLDVGDPSRLGKDVTQCARAVARAARTLVAGRLARSAACANAVLTCVQLDPGDATCLTRAALQCGSDAAKNLTAEAAFAVAVDKRCAAITFATLATAAGLDFASLESACVPVGVGSLGAYQDCLRRIHACGASALLTAEAPRASELFALVQRPLAAAYCPPP